MLSFYDEHTYGKIMKIALQLSGQIRFWKQSYEYWIELKSKLEESGFDVDIHIAVEVDVDVAADDDVDTYVDAVVGVDDVS